MGNYVRIPLRLNLDKKEHAEIMAILNDLDKNKYSTKNGFMIDALIYYIRHMGADEFTVSGKNKQGEAIEYATKSYVDDRLRVYARELKLYFYEHQGGQITRNVLDEKGKPPVEDKDVDLTQFPEIMKDINNWT